jgi:hypothetical protein
VGGQWLLTDMEAGIDQQVPATKGQANACVIQMYGAEVEAPSSGQLLLQQSSTCPPCLP